MEPVIDLHELNSLNAIEQFIKYYNERVKKKLYGEIEIIHGYGSTGQGGVIKRKLHKLFNDNLKKLSYKPGEDFSLNPGITMVKPKLLLPEASNILFNEILDFASDNPKSLEKITGKFRKYSTPVVTDAIKALVKKELLEVVNKGKVKCYQSKK